MRTETPMVIDCQTCPVRHVRCDDCIVTALAQTSSLPLVSIRRPGEWDGDEGEAPDYELALDAAERRAVDLFVRAGLVDAQHAATLTARRESSSGIRAVG
ncbi:MAG: hypothetical protein ABI890_17230 [Lapillicoccus sp.]